MENFMKNHDYRAVVMQCVEDVKHMHAKDMRWNVLLEKMQGVSTRFIGDDKFEICYLHYEVATLDDLARAEIQEDGKKFVKEFLGEIKKQFKEITGKTLSAKEKSFDINHEKVSRLSAETSYLVSASSRGWGHHPVGKFLVRESMILEVSFPKK
jgi:hypothetical protein